MEKFLLSKEKHISFHTPGHKGKDIFEGMMGNICKLDITEIPGADNLQSPDGIIKEIENRYARKYKVKKSYLSVNGSTAGILAMIMGCTNPGDKVIVDSNCHKSVINGLMLGHVTPVFVNCNIDDYGVPMAVEADDIIKVLNNNLDTKAVVITSPNYYGYVSDIRKIKNSLPEKDILIMIDEAHGSHLILNSSLPEDSISAGGDIVVQSIHKTLLGLTQTSVLHVNSNKINLEKLQYFLNIFQSSSPSYILMLSLEKSIDIIEKSGESLMKKLTYNIENFIKKSKSELKYLKVLDYRNNRMFDITKVIIDISSLDISTLQFIDILSRKYNIEVEMASGSNVLLMTSINNSEDDFKILLESLVDIEKKKSLTSEEKNRKIVKYGFNLSQIYTLWDAFYMEKEYVNIENAVERVAGASIVPYPPGIPIVNMGQKLSKEIVEYILENEKSFNQIVGIENGKIAVLKG